MTKRSRAAASFIFIVLLLVTVFVESRHRAAFGHFVPPGLHADFSIANADIGIPGITKLYDAHLTNFGPFPRRIERCEFTTDASAHGVSIGYRLQRWDRSSHRWNTVMDASSEYCRPYPLGIAQAKLTSKLLWPSQTISTGEEATGARGNLKGESMRFVLVANGKDFATSGFVIDEQSEGDHEGYRVKH